MNPRAAFLDRDGVLNELVPDRVTGRPESPLSVEDVALAPGAAAGALALRDAGFVLVGVTNQPAVAKGRITMAQLDAVQARILDLLAAEGVVFAAFERCLHHPDAVVETLRGPCACRKPEPGMLLDAAAHFSLDLTRSWMIGDTDADVAAGAAAGCRTALVEHPGSVHKRAVTARYNVAGSELRSVVAQVLSRDN